MQSDLSVHNKRGIWYLGCLVDGNQEVKGKVFIYTSQKSDAASVSSLELSLCTRSDELGSNSLQSLHNHILNANFLSFC